ncbi:MAG: DNA polymerase III subunit delta [Tannerella sp.]|jgi:DNA polymerase-3 subunit delta|nr:DNA polymerase III subunit delta [Tannerella sp.]
MAKKEYTFEEICRDIAAKNFAPVYVLMGEEPYFIDKIEELLVRNVLNDAERDFNQMIFYGNDSDALNIVNAARRFPMMAERQLVIVKEAQHLNKIEILSHYVKTPFASTVFVICHKYKKLDGRKNLLAEAKKVGIVFESKKIYDNKMPGFILSFMKQRAMDIDGKGAQMLADYIGNDLSRLEKEADKLSIIFGNSPSKRITPEIIETNIGVSKEFNSYQFVNAIASKDILRANRIADYFDKNPKINSNQPILPVVFNFFANLMICFYSKDRSEKGIMQTLHLQWPFQATDYLLGLRHYTAMKVFDAIREIRIADAKSKGFETTSSLTAGDIYKEMLYKIMH